ncbi:MAG: DNA replication/repair protein RecF [Bacillota bacterium]|nr:DNA replication/repair protein RecF [Bacillota bacterium]
MYARKLELTDFRNYENLEIEFHPKVNIIIGDNAQGKTNLLEAVYITSVGKSFRTSRDIEMIRFGCGFCRVLLCAEKQDQETEIDIVIRKEGKSIRVGEKQLRKLSEMFENVLTVVFSPEDLKIVKEDPEKRRRFINREISQLRPAYFSRLAEYNRILKQRNAYLKERDINEDVLDVWDESLAKNGAYIMKSRGEFIEKLEKISRRINEDITSGKEFLSISYEPDIELVSEDAQEEVFAKTLKINRQKDLERRTTTKGPHKDDMKITVNDTDIRHYGSQGQQRTAALSLKLAEIGLIKEEMGEDAILLLDDVLSELDPKRQSYLINSLKDVQLFITTAEMSPEVAESLPEGKTFLVTSGKVEEKSNSDIAYT